MEQGTGLASIVYSPPDTVAEQPADRARRVPRATGVEAWRWRGGTRDLRDGTMGMAEQEPRETPPETPGGRPDAGSGGPAPDAAASPAPEETPARGETAAASGEAVAPPSPDVWPAIDTVLQAFGAERGVGIGTFWGTSAGQIEGRFAGWSNASGWRCTLQLVRAPEENVVVLVAQGPPLPGGRARVMVLGAFPPEFEADTLRAALEVGYGIGETWGPAEEPPEPSPAADTAAPATGAEPA